MGYALAKMCAVWCSLSTSKNTDRRVMPRVLEISSTLSAYERSNKNESKDERRKGTLSIYSTICSGLFFMLVGDSVLSMGQIMTECAMCGSRAILTNAEGFQRCAHCDPIT